MRDRRADGRRGRAGVRRLPAREIAKWGKRRAGRRRHARMTGRMQLNDEEQAMLGRRARARSAQIALEHQIKVGDFFGAPDFVPVTQAHIMADTESLGEAGVRWLERSPTRTGGRGRVRIPTITDPRGTDFAKAGVLEHARLDADARAARHRRLRAAGRGDDRHLHQLPDDPGADARRARRLRRYRRRDLLELGLRRALQLRRRPVGARRPGLTGRTPRYGFHLEAQRQATVRSASTSTPQSLNEWGALGGVIGRLAGNYWAVPVIEGLEGAPGSDAMKHFGAAMASFGSIALFHLVGITPEAAHARATSAATGCRCAPDRRSRRATRCSASTRSTDESTSSSSRRRS